MAENGGGDWFWDGDIPHRAGYPIKPQKEALSRIVAARQRHRADLMTLALQWIRRFKCELQGRCDQRSGARR